jgi:hypothetical protein
MPRLKFITLVPHMFSENYLSAGSFISDLHRKFLFLDLLPEREVFCRPDRYNDSSQSILDMVKHF